MREEVVGRWDDSAVAVKESPQLGRHVVAVREMSPMQVLLVESPAVLVRQGPNAEQKVCELIAADTALTSSLCDTVTPLHPAADPKELRQLYANSFCHSASVDDDVGEATFVALYRSVSMLNHSCAPNAALVTTFGRNATSCESRVVTLRTVQPGEQVCIAYQVLLRPTVERRQVLRERYGFTCECVRCSAFDAAGGAETDDAFLLSTLPPEVVDPAAVRRVEAIIRNAAFFSEIRGQDPLAASMTQTFAVLWRFVLRVERTDLGGGKSSVSLRFPVFPASNHVMHELREVFLAGACRALEAATADADADADSAVAAISYLGVDSAFFAGIAQQHIAVLSCYFLRYFENDAELLRMALEKLIPGFAVYSRWR